MRTPIADFLRKYDGSDAVRFHMPGHKGESFIGCEGIDLTEINGADDLYNPCGIIAESERNATYLFGTQRTCYSTEGSSQCIRAMLYLAVTQREKNRSPIILAARNVHKAFVYAAALIGFDIEWIYPEKTNSLCRCDISPDEIDRKLKAMPSPPAAVYITGVDYLGGTANIANIAEVCHRNGTVLAVDNAHGAYLHFLPKPIHPMDCGADICCDSAHKTFPVLTGGAYLHIGKGAPKTFAENAKSAMALFGSTSPSYLITASLDLCNGYLADGFRERLNDCINTINGAKNRLKEHGWRTEKSDPLRITVRAPEGLTGYGLADRLRRNKIECEYSDRQYLVLMATPENRKSDFDRLIEALGENANRYAEETRLTMPKCKKTMSVREAFFRPKETMSVDEVLGRICASPTVSCPPAIPIAVSGEIIDENAVNMFKYYGIDKIEVIV